MPEMSKNLVAAAGEFLVCAELCRRNVLALLTPKNNPVFDVLACEPAGGRSVAIQVKTMAFGNDQGWKMGVDMERPLGNENLFVVLVNMRKDAPNEFYIFGRDELAGKVAAVYADYISKPKQDGTPKRPVPFRWFDFKDFTEEDTARRDRWDLLGLPLHEPV